jgi:two-component system, cell cycle sensor histidine kinase and response regulator CckA
LQSEQLELTAKLHQSQRLEALGRLAGGIAHDFNNLLTVIGGNLSLLELSSAHEGDSQFALTEAADATQRAAALTRQLLTFSRQQIVEPRAFNPGQCLTQLRRLLQRILGEDILLSIEVAEDPLCLFMDTSQFEQIVMNLVVNARDAMRTGGRLDVSLERASTTLGGVQRNCALLTVSDTGTGIPESVVSRVFEPFFTTKAPGSGTGLGLATVHSIVTEASGTIAVQPGLERGTVFRIHLPLWEGAPPSVESGAKPESLRVTRGVVVVVEDQEPIRNLVVRILERAGFNVTAFADANAALDYARKEDSHFNVLLTDVVMPAMGGRALSDEIRKLRPEVPVVFMSGHPGDMDLHEVAQGPGKYFIAKPFTPDNLSRTLSIAIEQGT